MTPCGCGVARLRHRRRGHPCTAHDVPERQAPPLSGGQPTTREVHAHGQREISGISNPGNFANDRETAAEAARTGRSHQGKGNNPANFANDRQKASEADHSDGQASGSNVTNDREKASEAGKKGGQASHVGGDSDRR